MGSRKVILAIDQGTTSTKALVMDQAGTILGSSRTNPFKDDESVDRVLATIASVNLDALIAIGGDDTLGVAHQLNAL